MKHRKESTIHVVRSGMFALVGGILATSAGIVSAAENACVQAYPDDITLRDAIEAAPANPKKNYTIVLTTDCTVEDDELVVSGRISIVGNGNDIHETVGNPPFPSIFSIGETGNLTLNDVNLIGETLTGIDGPYSSAIYNEGAVTYNGGQMSGFASIFGAVINAGKMTLNGVTIGNNLAQGGGGILNYGQLAVNHSFIGVDDENNPMPNTAGFGGGIYNVEGGIFNNQGGVLSLNNTVVAYNVADGGPSNLGGGIYNGGDATLYLNSGTLITGNTTTDNGSGDTNAGAGIYNDGNVDINRAEILSNTAESDGGGIYNDTNGVITVNRGSIASNMAGNLGGGVYNDGSLTVYKFGSITNNTPDDVSDFGTCLSYGEIGSVSNGSCSP